jgi:predicted helicase
MEVARVYDLSAVNQRHFRNCQFQVQRETTEGTESKNLAICCTSHSQMPFSCMVTNCLPNEAVGGRNGQCLGLYGFSEDGKIQADNITDWSLAAFRGHYVDKSISKEQIFSHTYAMLPDCLKPPNGDTGS